jgi:hypothetical protein
MGNNKQREHNKRILPESRGLHTKINLTRNFTAEVTGHGNIKSYLHKFKMIGAPDCP